jgi:mRNA (guanine-N7-)-methyltransferase
VEQREFSPIIGLKKFNNWIKSVLIGKFTYRPRNGPGAKVLDMGCGKGGDLNKWKQAKIQLYVGLGESALPLAPPLVCSRTARNHLTADIAATSIDQADERYRKMYHPPYRAQFFAFDCFSVSLLCSHRTRDRA